MPIANDQADEDLEAVLADYLRAAEEGRAPDRMELLARHPDLAPELAAFFAGQERFTRLAAPLRDAVSAAQESTIDDKLAEGGRLGDFRLLREVGRGGMGIVYEAEQISLGRKVALKILPFAGALDAKQLQRFKNEAHAAAHLQHQNIVPVYFVGCERGVHFYAMQFVEGQTLAALIQELRHASQKIRTGSRVARSESSKGVPRKITDQPTPFEDSGRATPHIDPQPTGPYTAELKSSATIGEDSPEAEKAAATVQDRDALIETVSAPTRSSILDSPSSFFRTVANLGIQAAEALEHAHQLGVIHRDIKPGNLMLTHDGQLKVLDFGIARLRDMAGPTATQTGMVMGTPAFMAPEVFGGNLADAHSDQFSFCVALYEAVTRLAHPQPVSMLWAVALASVIGFVGNEAVAIFRIRVGREIGSAALVADGQHARVDGWTSLSVLVGAFGVWAGFPLADPFIGVLISIAIFLLVWQSAKVILTRMLDGVEPHILDEIGHAAGHARSVQGVSDVRARWIGHRLHVEMSVTVPGSLSVGEGHDVGKEVRHQLLHHLPHLGSVTVHIDPDGQEGEQHHRIEPHVHDGLPIHAHE